MLVLSLAGCGDRQVERVEVMTDFPAEPEAVRLEERPGVAPEEEGRLLLTEEGLQSPRYTFRYAQQFTAPENELALRLEYSADIELQLRLDFEEADPLIAPLPDSSGRQSVMVVPIGTELPQTF